MNFLRRQARLKKMTLDELLAEQQRIMSDPKSKAQPGSFRIHTPSAQRRLDDIAWAITALKIRTATDREDLECTLRAYVDGRKSNEPNE